ncbi:alpha/beta hydrolase [Nocardioides jishulii]|uniref:DUF1023 domain-containing protein n=1 Tax=Nocardioides jishulii TaxID=2575440 RepID=A0A4U2YUP4_9ACTN|nr:alpha/beta hydrolase [Nocardioides jishulii]QCX28303.1 hypothetical protein FCL41_12825 [Nocardioides jishulii]TKI64804.1 hypothetical protein FC770_06745 [Nocardioides jishulii]
MSDDHFTLDVHPDQVNAARRRVERVLHMLADRTPPVLRTPDEVDAQWNGGAADRVKSEMRALGEELDAADQRLKKVSRELRRLADSYRDALDELPSLNRRWEAALDAHGAAVASANQWHTQRLHDIASSKKDEAAAQDANTQADGRRDRAIDDAQGALSATKRQLNREFEELRETLRADTRSAARAMTEAMPFTPSGLRRLTALGGFRNRFRRRHWTDLVREKLASRLPLAAGHHEVVTTLEAYGLAVPAEGDAARGEELVARLDAELDALAGLDAATRSERIQAWTSTLSSEDLSLLVLVDPVRVGNLDGIPNKARYAANRANLAAGIASEQAQLERYWTPPPGTDHPRWAEYTRLVDRIAMLEDLHKLPVNKLPHQVLAFEPPTYDGNEVVDDGRLAVVKGDLDRATFVGTVVPGITNRIDNFDATLEKASNIQALTAGSATIAWLGYDTPEFADASSAQKSEVGGQALKDFTDGLVRGENSELTIIAHSYGTLVTSKAIQLGMTPDRVVLFGSPGLGENIEHKDDLGLPPDVPVYALRAFGDPVSVTAGHGTDPVDMPGVIRLDTDWSGPEGVTGHSQYTQTGTDSLRNIAGVLAGQQVRPPGVQGPGYLEAGGNALDKDGFAGAYNDNLRDLVDRLQKEVPPDVLESFVLHLEPTLQNVMEGGAQPGMKDVGEVAAMVRRAMDESGIADHLTRAELLAVLEETEMPELVGELAGDAAGDWLSGKIGDLDQLDDLTIRVRGLEIKVPDHANEVLGRGLGNVLDAGVGSTAEWATRNMPGLDAVLDTAEMFDGAVKTGTTVIAVTKAIPDIVRNLPRPSSPILVTPLPKLLR